MPVKYLTASVKVIDGSVVPYYVKSLALFDITDTGSLSDRRDMLLFEKTYRALSYSRNYVQTLILISIVSTMVMQAVGDSLAL
jgi:hypothetical protein